MTLYGLPEIVKFCVRCTQSNQRPSSAIEFRHTFDSAKTTLHIDKDGVCDACRYAERKKETIDWEVREAQLKRLLDKHRRSDGWYDCLVPGSGGKDSYYAAWMLKNKYGMNPLLCTWEPTIYTDWGKRNHERWVEIATCLTHTHGDTHRLLTRLAVDNLLHPFQTFILGQKNYAPKVAAEHGIKLVFYGESESEHGNPIADTGSAQRDWDYFTSSSSDDIYLSGVSLRELHDTYGLDFDRLEPYLPADQQEIADREIDVRYLGYYLPWHPQGAYYHAVEHGGFECSPERTPGTYSKYNSIDDAIDDFHYFTTYIKFGIGRATYDSSQEIRNGDLTREEGVALVRQYDGEYPARFEKKVFDYLNIEGFPEYDRESFLAHCDKFRSPHLWDGRKIRHTVYAKDTGDSAA